MTNRIDWRLRKSGVSTAMKTGRMTIVGDIAPLQCALVH